MGVVHTTLVVRIPLSSPNYFYSSTVHVLRNAISLLEHLVFGLFLFQIGGTGGAESGYELHGVTTDNKIYT